VGPPSSSPYLISVAVADVTGDGRTDVIASSAQNSPGGVVDVFQQNTNGTLAAPVWYDANQIPQSIEASDLNGDGRTDVAVINNAHGLVTFLYQRADGSLGNQESSRTATAQHPAGQGLAFGDVNHDGRQDIVSVADTALNIMRPVSLLVRGGAVQAVSPVEHSTGAALGTTPQVTFATSSDPSTVNASTVRLVDGRTGAAVPGAVSFDAGTRTATFTPASPLQRAKPYRIVVDGVRTATAEPVLAFASTFTTTGTGPLAALSNFAVRGQLGVAASVSAGVPIGDLGDVIVRYAAGSTGPASPTGGAAGYTGVGGGIMVGGLAPGQTYSFAVWYRDRAGNLSPRSAATLTGLTLTMSGVTTDAQPLVPSLTFAGTVATPAGPGVGVPVPLTARCADGPPAGVTAATATGNASGALSATLTLTSPRCSFRWEITNSTSSMGAASTVVRGPTDFDPPSGPTPPRDR
jgi:serine protease